MKNLLLLMVMLTIPFTALAQDEQTIGSRFPYEKMLKMTDEQLKESRFKYDDYMNQWVLTKLNGLNQTAAILGALSNTPANYVPHVNDYKVVVQKGAEGVASVKVIFYDNAIYHKILTFANDKGSALLETSSGKLTKMQFNYDSYSFELNRETVVQSNIVAGDRNAVSKDQSYGVFSFSIYTGEQPSSKWLDREAEKQAKRDEKGKKKRSSEDFM